MFQHTILSVNLKAGNNYDFDLWKIIKHFRPSAEGLQLSKGLLNLKLRDLMSSLIFLDYTYIYLYIIKAVCSCEMSYRSASQHAYISRIRGLWKARWLNFDRRGAKVDSSVVQKIQNLGFWISSLVPSIIIHTGGNIMKFFLSKSTRNNRH